MSQERETKTVILRVPRDLHRLARLKSVGLEISLNEILNKKLAEWVREPEPPTEIATPKPRRAKQPVAA